MQGGEELSIDELASNLSTYKDQLQQVRKLLVDDPGNSEYMDMEKELEEVIFIHICSSHLHLFIIFFFFFFFFNISADMEKVLQEVILIHIFPPYICGLFLPFFLFLIFL